MKKDEVKVGGTYTAKVTDKVVPVRLDKENPRGGWDATNLVTNKQVRIKSAQRLRSEVKVPDAVKDANAEAPPEEAKPNLAKKKLSAAERKALLAQHPRKQADQENARLDEERAKSDDGMTASERAMAASEKGAKSGKKKTKAAPKEKKPKKLSLIDAAAQVLGESKEPMNCKQMVEQVTAKKLWSSDAATPWATLYSAILRETQNKGDDARFTKVDRGRFTLSPAGKKGA